MNKSEKIMRLEMIKSIGDRKKVMKDNDRLKALIIKMACCGNCDWWSGRICTHSEWCIRVEDKNDMCIKDLWILKK